MLMWVCSRVIVVILKERLALEEVIKLRRHYVALKKSNPDKWSFKILNIIIIIISLLESCCRERINSVFFLFNLSFCFVVCAFVVLTFWQTCSLEFFLFSFCIFVLVGCICKYRCVEMSGDVKYEIQYLLNLVTCFKSMSLHSSNQHTKVSSIQRR